MAMRKRGFYRLDKGDMEPSKEGYCTRFPQLPSREWCICTYGRRYHWKQYTRTSPQYERRARMDTARGRIPNTHNEKAQFTVESKQRYRFSTFISNDPTLVVSPPIPAAANYNGDDYDYRLCLTPNI